MMPDIHKDLFDMTLKKAEKLHGAALPNIKPVNNGIEVVCPKEDDAYWTNLMSKAFEEARLEYLKGTGYAN